MLSIANQILLQTTENGSPALYGPVLSYPPKVEEEDKAISIEAEVVLPGTLDDPSPTMIVMGVAGHPRGLGGGSLI